MNCHLYLRNGTVYLPTMGVMDKGFYRGVEPVAVVSLTDIKTLREALIDTISRGNPVVPMLRRRDWPPPILLKYTGLRSWSAFERGMQLWDIKEKDGMFQIAGNTKRPNGMWLGDPEQTITFPAGTPVGDVADRMIAILQQAQKE
jgi:hypothetical protein